MTETNVKTMTIETIERQEKYVAEQQKKGKGVGIVFADAFLRGMRDIGYKNPAWALAEDLDNSFQAAADKVAIRFGFAASNKTHVKPDKLAVCDNGNGMIPAMISYAVRWGGTDREGDRHGFGRYGYGLPSSAVSLGKRYTVYSKPVGGQWHAVTVDIDQLADAANDLVKTEELLTARPAEPPAWIAGAAHDDDVLDVKALKSGTIITFEELDRLNRLGGWIKVESLRTKLLQHFGVIYRHWISEKRIFVDGVEAQVVDPLFLMEHGRFFAETSVRAERVEARSFEVKTPSGAVGTVRVRASVLPPNFQLADPTQYGHKGAKMNKRHDIMKAYNGLQICRERRQIDCIPPKWTKFQNYDLNTKIEIDFDPELDEFFGITTSKQQITIDDEMWERLQHSGKDGGGLGDLIEDIRRRADVLRAELKANAENIQPEEGPRPSVVAIESTAKFKETAVSEPTAEQQQEAQKNLEDLAVQQAQVLGEPKEKVLQQLTEKAKKRRWEVEFVPIPEGPFYRPKRLGEQKRLIINTDHPFYTKVYDPSPEVRGALEVLLIVLAERELEVKDDAETFYRAERGRWSERLRRALDTLMPDDAMADKASAVAEQMMDVDYESVK